jgi:hypothetical protein
MHYMSGITGSIEIAGIIKIAKWFGEFWLVPNIKMHTCGEDWVHIQKCSWNKFS